jgi:hypothetical protein
VKSVEVGFGCGPSYHRSRVRFSKTLWQLMMTNGGSVPQPSKWQCEIMNIGAQFYRKRVTP